MTTPADILRQAINSQIENIHTAIPASIVNYDFEEQKATVQPLIRNRFRDGRVEDMPEIVAVPVIFPRTANFSLHYPLNRGDYVLLLFMEKSIDQWLETGGQSTPLDSRKFDLSDAVAIPGLYPFSLLSPAEDNENVQVNFGLSKIKISPTGQYCVHGASEELMSILDELFTAISAITIAADQSGVPNPVIPINNLSTFTALQTRFNTLKGDC